LQPSKLLAQAQGTQTEFGKNRVQYKDFQWFFYRSPNFDTYYYKDGKELGAMVGKMAEQNLKEIEEVLDYKLEGRIKILSYNKLSDLKQTNLGLVTDAQQNTGGVTQIIGDKLFIYFDGNTLELQKQIRAGIAEILISEMLYGGNLQEKLSNATLLTLPDWYIQGLKSYLSEDWNVELDNKLKDGILNKRLNKFNRIPEKDAKVVGHSIWKYVVDNYGAASISNIVYMTRVNRNAETGFTYIIGLTFKELGPQWLAFYKQLYSGEDLNKELQNPKELITHKRKKRTKSLTYAQLKVAPDGKSYAYVVNRDGRFSVYLYNLESNKTKRVFKTGMKSTAFTNRGNEPILSWHPSSVFLAISYEKKSMAWVEIINLKEKKERVRVNMYKYEKILDFDYSNDGRKWIISAIRNGQSDLYLYDIPSRRDEQLTFDWYDDLNPRFIKNATGIMFSSNRSNDSIQRVEFNKLANNSNSDLFLYDLNNRNGVLKRLTKTPFANESKPIALDTNLAAYLSDETGIINRHILRLDSTVDYKYDTTIFYVDTTITVYKDSFSTYPASNYARNITAHDFSKRSKRFTEQLDNQGRTQIYLRPLNGKYSDSTNQLYSTFAQKKRKKEEQAIAKIIEQARQDSIAIADSLRIAARTDSLINLAFDSTMQDVSRKDFDSYYFQTDFPRKKSEQVIAITQKTATGYQVIYVKDKQSKSVSEVNNAPTLNDYFRKSSPIPYNTEIATNYVVTQIDNSLITNTYQQFTGVGPIFVNSNINALIKVGTADLMEDHRFVGGFRLSGNLTVPEYFLSYENLKKRLDKQFIFYKQGGDDFFGFNAVRTNSYEFKFIGKYPLDEHRSIRTSLFYRRDETIVLSTDSFSLNLPNFYRNNLGYRVEYVFDNTIPKGLNLYNGTRYKLYVEQFKELDNPNGNMINLGFDFRHYEKIHRQIIFAGRVAGSSSIGAQKVMYYLGGVDGWLIPRFNNDIQVDRTRTYKYQALATNMRGFTQNIRNGNNFVVANAEVRMPVFAYFLNRPMKSDFVKNFQLVPFGDIGAAWVGADPFSAENRFNRIEVQGPPVSVTAIESKYPFVGGFGWGARSRILGYFIRFDMAWGVQNNRVAEKPVYYVSLSLDF
jgi:hypothetical protein